MRIKDIVGNVEAVSRLQVQLGGVPPCAGGHRALRPLLCIGVLAAPAELCSQHMKRATYLVAHFLLRRRSLPRRATCPTSSWR